MRYFANSQTFSFLLAGDNCCVLAVFLVSLPVWQCLSPSPSADVQASLPVLGPTRVEFYFLSSSWGRGRPARRTDRCHSACDALRTYHASFKDLCGAVAPAHRLAGGTDCRPAAANHSSLLRQHKDVSANQVLLRTCGLGAVPERDELQLCGRDVLRLVGEPQECSQGEGQVEKRGLFQVEQKRLAVS